MQDILRKLIWVQDKIHLMENVLKKFPVNLSECKKIRN